MGGHKLRLGHAHGWTWRRGADADVDYFAMIYVTLIDWRDVLWLLEGAERMVATVMRGGCYDRTLAASNHPQALRKLHSLREIFLVPYCPD